MEKNLETTIVYWGYFGIVEEKINGNYYSILGSFVRLFESGGWEVQLVLSCYVQPRTIRLVASQA